ncbi:semaphorin-5B-like [Patiria miniata]|uniref:Sema domain-containing protein n=1 Tax=Patiria miniata TaxID=46514 RepID=A0A914BC60_PATMI|nr:semaphorin-5B-like [Patiria miniata]XP_038073421.1 semaphorin-5B-like [Patiria miniata]
MSVAHRVSWLVLGILLVCQVPACYSQNENVLRKGIIPDPPCKWTDVSGLLMTYGPNPSAEGKYYRTLEFIDGQLFVGGKAQLFAVDPANLDMLDSVSIPTTGSSLCEFCDNYIRVIQPLTNNTLLECGTNNKVPYCQQRSMGNLSVASTPRIQYDPSSSSPTFVAPFTYNQNSTGWFLTKDLELFVGTNLELSAGELSRPAIVKSVLQSDSSQNVVGVEVQLRTKDDESVLSKEGGPPNPQFVGDPISYNGRVYFFFREIAVEFISESLVYSRVAVVCQNDTGGTPDTDLNENNIATFVKARLTCSIDGAIPYDYNEIHDIYQSTDDVNVVFAIFATRAPVVASSAVCAYRLDEIEALFLNTENKFTFQENNGEIWKDLATDPITPRLVTCQNTDSFSSTTARNILSQGQIMSVSAENKLHYETAGGAQSNPLLVIDGERFSQIVVDENVVNSIDVMFIGTENGAVLKAYLNANRSEAKVVEEISLDTDGRKTPVLTMLLSDSDQAVFVGTDIGVYKVPFQHCQDSPSRMDCLGTEDPYCRWNGTSCVNSDVGEQDLETGADNTEPSILGITVHLTPNSPTRYLNVPNQPINLYLFAEAPTGQNLRVANDEVQCTPCASLPYTEYRASSSGKEFLSLLIDGSNSAETTNCSCTVVLAIDGGSNSSVNFDLTVDNSAAVSANDDEISDLEIFDNEIRRYKKTLQNWQTQVGESCGLTDVQLCQP